MAGYYDYPVDLIGEYDERVNRFLWLIKWLLLLPHYIVLTLLSLPTIATTPLSWLAVVIMGRYPRFLWAYHTGAVAVGMACGLLWLLSGKHRPVPTVFL